MYQEMHSIRIMATEGGIIAKMQPVPSIMVFFQALQLLLQELLDVTRQLLADMDRERQGAAQKDCPYGAPNLDELKLDADQDELREKFGIVRVRPH